MKKNPSRLANLLEDFLVATNLTYGKLMECECPHCRKRIARCFYTKKKLQELDSTNWADAMFLVSIAQDNNLKIEINSEFGRRCDDLDDFFINTFYIYITYDDYEDEKLDDIPNPELQRAVLIQRFRHSNGFHRYLNKIGVVYLSVFALAIKNSLEPLSFYTFEQIKETIKELQRKARKDPVLNFLVLSRFRPLGVFNELKKSGVLILKKERGRENRYLVNPLPCSPMPIFRTPVPVQTADLVRKLTALIYQRNQN